MACWLGVHSSSYIWSSNATLFLKYPKAGMWYNALYFIRRESIDNDIGFLIFDTQKLYMRGSEQWMASPCGFSGT